MRTESITTKQLEILILLYRFRFLTRIHIQQFLHHKNHTRITPWLKDLTNKHIINRIYSQTQENINKPAIYYLATKRKPILSNQKQCTGQALQRVYREKYRSKSFIANSLFLVDLCFHFQKAAQDQQAECHFYTATDLLTVNYAPLPLPSAYLTILQPNKVIKRYFLEVFSDSIPMFAIRRRIQQYCRYYQSNYWQDHNADPFPKIFVICPTERIKKSLLYFIPKLLEEQEVDIVVFLGLKDSIIKSGIQPDTWDKVY
jgi:hypothetical protein